MTASQLHLLYSNHQQVAMAITLDVSCIQKGKQSTHQNRMLTFIHQQIKNKDVFLGKRFNSVQVSGESKGRNHPEEEERMPPSQEGSSSI